MDSVTNGEVSEDSLSNPKEATSMLTSEEGVKEAKHLNEVKAMAETENSKTDATSLSGPTYETSQSNEASDQNTLSSSCSTSNSKVVTGENSHKQPSESSSPSREGSNDLVKSPRKENGISDSANLLSDTEKNSRLITDQNGEEKLDLSAGVTNTPSSLNNKESSSKKSDKVSIQSPDGELAEKCNKSEMDLSCSDVRDKKENISLIEQSSEMKDLNNSGINAVEMKDAEVKTSKNKLMCGSSVVIDSSRNQVQDTKLDSKQCSEKNKTNLIKCVPEQAESCIDLTNDDCNENSAIISNEHPLNFAKEKEQQIPLKALESNTISNSSERGSLVDLSVNKWPQENPLQKLNEHLKSIGTDKERVPFNHNHIQKSDCSANTSFSKGSEKMLSSGIYDKENKIEDTHQHERSIKESSDSFVFAELSNEETGFPDAFVGMVTIGKYISVKGDFTLRSTEALVESPSLVAPYLLKEPDIFPPKEKDSKSETKDFFHSAAGELLIGIGISRVNEWFHKDMVRIKKRQMKRSGKTPQLEEELKLHEDLYAEAKKANTVYSFTYQSCKNCGFTSESSIVMEGHLLVPHVTPRREYQCNFCDSINRDPKAMLEHMMIVHEKIGRIQPPVLFFECPYCSFESNSKVKLNNHLAKCQRYFDHGINQAPPKDFEFPCLTPKPITVAVVKAYEKSLGSMQRGRGRPKKDISESLHMNQFTGSANLAPLTPNHMPAFRAGSNSPLADSLSVQNQMIPPIQMPNMNIRPAHSNVMGQLRPAISHLHMPPPNRFFHFVNPSGQVMPIMGNNHLVTSASQFPFSPPIDTSLGKKSSSSPNFSPMLGTNLRQQTSSKGMPSVTITPLPKLQGPYPVPMAKPATASGSASMQSNSLVVCEICDGYIKDLEQLRTHMQLIHKVKIHPKMLVSRPPLNCQKCQWRFFTDQGLERHLLGAHGLVTSNMQELANKGKDAGCCTICGRVYASKLVSHMNQVHKITLKPAHLSYKCTVCSATFNLYRLFENHVYLVHSGAAKRSADGRSSPSKRMKSLDDSITDIESSNHKEKGSSKDIGDENCNKCKECGNDKKSQNEKCDKCLKSDELVQGTTLSTKTLNDELRKTDKAIEKAAA
ncbi:unnamed protein product [Larinioides sclopetarius]|uniref:MOG interacting and ectopic P-granules protein 1 n=1 Tax=Larinioides sclopetarius TaxID=280406 RepID=A0AAV2BV19_9ARAC